jgi:hypothetical protein
MAYHIKQYYRNISGLIQSGTNVGLYKVHLALITDGITEFCNKKVLLAQVSCTVFFYYKIIDILSMLEGSGLVLIMHWLYKPSVHSSNTATPMALYLPRVQLFFTLLIDLLWLIGVCMCRAGIASIQFCHPIKTASHILYAVGVVNWHAQCPPVSWF